MLKLRMKKWDPDRHCYEPYPYSDEWNVGFFCTVRSAMRLNGREKRNGGT